MVYFFIVLVVVCIAVFLFVHRDLKSTENVQENKAPKSEYEKALKKFKNDGFYNFKICMVYYGENLIFYIEPSGEISVYMYKNGQYVKILGFTDDESGRAYRENIKNIFIDVVFTKKFKVVYKLYENLSGNIFVKYEDDNKIYSINWTNPSNSKQGTARNDISEIENLCNSFKLPPGSSFDDFKKKYRQLCKKYHPDIYGSDDMMKKINITFERVEIYFGKR